VTAETREGVAVAFVQPVNLRNRDGETGIRSVDLFLRSVNPAGLRRPPIIASPDRGGRVVRTTDVIGS
jgi:hypothetical protein